MKLINIAFVAIASAMSLVGRAAEIQSETDEAAIRAIVAEQEVNKGVMS